MLIGICADADALNAGDVGAGVDADNDADAADATDATGATDATDNDANSAVANADVVDDAPAVDAAATDDDAVAYAPFDAGAGVGAEC